MTHATFGPSHVTFRRYPFWPASRTIRGGLRYHDIESVDTEANPPEIRTHADETLFVAGAQSDALKSVATEKGIADERRFDAWKFLLNPYLDTEPGPDDDAYDRRTLHAAGFDEHTVRAIRRRVAAPVLAYNAWVWEWGHLGLYDVLVAMRQSFSVEMLRSRLWPPRYATFYNDAMRIAARGRRFRPS